VPDKLVAVSVLNGEVQAGDRVAYATRHGSWMDMNIATVLEVGEKDHAWKTLERIPVLKVEVTRSSSYRQMQPYKTTVTVLDRVVKL
jgi:hypothetical protein